MNVVISAFPASPPAKFTPFWKKNPLSPNSSLSPPNAIAKPTAHQTTDATARLTRIFATPAPTLFPREKPSSRPRKPICMKNTSAVPRISQSMLTSPARSSRPWPMLWTLPPKPSSGTSTADAAEGSSIAPAATVAAAPSARSRRPPRGAAASVSYCVARASAQRGSCACLDIRGSSLFGRNTAWNRWTRPLTRRMAKDRRGRSSRPARVVRGGEGRDGRLGHRDKVWGPGWGLGSLVVCTTADVIRRLIAHPATRPQEHRPA